MNKKKRAIKIDVARREVCEIEIEPWLEVIYEIIGCGAVNKLPFFQGNSVWVGDAGPLAEPQSGDLVVLSDGRTFFGNGLVIGSDQDGRRLDTTLDAATVAAWVHFFHYARQASGPANPDQTNGCPTTAARATTTGRPAWTAARCWEVTDILARAAKTACINGCHRPALSA